MLRLQPLAAASDLRPQTSNLRPQTSDLRPQTSDLRPQNHAYQQVESMVHSTQPITNSR